MVCAYIRINSDHEIDFDWFVVDIGSRDEPRGLEGVSHFIEHMVFKGTTHRDARQIAAYLESVGGILNAFTSREQTCYYAKVIDEHLPRAVDVIADLAFNGLSIKTI
jgi:predicted Zn-dependent peptidase